MKKLILIVSMFVCVNLYAQSDNSSDSDKNTTIFATLKGEITGKVEADFGNGDFQTLTTDEGGKFRSLVSALNYMSAKGWVVVTVFDESEEKDHYILIKKEVSKEEASVVIENGIKQK